MSMIDEPSISRAVAWERLHYELYGESPRAKTEDVARGFFDNAAVFINNCNATFQFGFILPLKEKTIGLTEKEEAYLDVYRQHTALCSGIEKVQTAYKSYISAQEAADQALTNSKSIPARKRAITEGEALVKNYNELIELAIDQATSIGLKKTEYLKDLHEKLEKTYGDILYTVNTIRPKTIEKDHLGSESKKILRSNYLKFVTQFVSNVREARLQSGNSSDDISGITDAFIEGLATIPELGELDDGLVLIELYDELTKQQDIVAKTQNEVVDYFRGQIEALMNQERDITTEDLQKLQYKGISLLSVMKTFDVDQLNDLKDSGNNLRNIQRDIQIDEIAIREREQVIAESVDYSFQDVHVFLKDAEVANLEGIPNDGTALDVFAKAYTEALKIHVLLTQQINETTERQEEAQKARTKEIADNTDELAVLDEQIKGHGIEIKTAHSQIDIKAEELRNFESSIAKRLEELSKKDDKIAKLEIAGLQEKSAEHKVSLQVEIGKLKDNLQEMQRAFTIQQNAALKISENLIKLTDANDEESEQEAQVLQDLSTQLKKLETRQIAELTGEEVHNLATHLNIKDRVLSLSPIATRLDGVVRSKDEVLHLKMNVHSRQSRAEKFLAKLTNVSLNDKGALVVDAAMFGAKEKIEISAQLESNLVIAKEVTMAVGRKIVEQDNEFVRQKAEEDKGSLRSQRIYSNMESKLERELNAREEKEVKGMYHEGLYDLVNARISCGSGKPMKMNRLLDFMSDDESSKSGTLNVLSLGEVDLGDLDIRDSLDGTISPVQASSSEDEDSFHSISFADEDEPREEI